MSKATGQWDGEVGEIERLVGYGGETGPVFAKRCFTCGAFVKTPEIIEWDTHDRPGIEPTPHASTNCHRCGPTELVHMGWACDFEAVT